MLRVARRERTALQAVYRLTSAKLFGICLRILHDRAEAEDVLQEIYLTVWQKAAEFDPGRSSSMTWLMTIARNRSIDRLRSKARARYFEPIDAAAEIPDVAPLPEQMLADGEARAKLMVCLGNLPLNERNALRGAFFDGNTYEELAKRIGVPLGTMKSWIRRALQKLRTCLDS
jgi:RNA polymerase sigma-70 factor (ECF subfamily)